MLYRTNIYLRNGTKKILLLQMKGVASVIVKLTLSGIYNGF